MSSRTAARVAWGLVALTVALLVAGLVAYTASGTPFDLTVTFIWTIGVVFSVVGALIATRQPGNAIGWTFLWVGVSAAVGDVAHAYADYWLGGRGGAEALGGFAATYANVSWIPFILVPATFIVLLFPDGHLLSRRWRHVARCAAVGIAGTFVTSFLAPGKLEDYPTLENPYAAASSALDPLTGLSWLLMLIGIAGSSVSLIVRFRRARFEQRQQMKWLALAGAVAAVTIPVGIVGSPVWGEGLSYAAIMLSVLGLPAAAGVAILRHRLYDIDVVINRTLVYAALTATLAGAYLAGVLVLQLALSSFTEGSGLAVAGSTLGVAALFRPARLRIQELVDRRFYRRRYDAARTLEGFSARVRDEVDLSALEPELRGVVAATMQPTHVSLWLQPTPEWAEATRALEGG